jgi:hypothetical protein
MPKVTSTQALWTSPLRMALFTDKFVKVTCSALCEFTSPVTKYLSTSPWLRWRCSREWLRERILRQARNTWSHKVVTEPMEHQQATTARVTVPWFWKCLIAVRPTTQLSMDQTHLARRRSDYADVTTENWLRNRTCMTSLWCEGWLFLRLVYLWCNYVCDCGSFQSFKLEENGMVKPSFPCPNTLTRVRSKQSHTLFLRLIRSILSGSSQRETVSRM